MREAGAGRKAPDAAHREGVPWPVHSTAASGVSTMTRDGRALSRAHEELTQSNETQSGDPAENGQSVRAAAAVLSTLHARRGAHAQPEIKHHSRPAQPAAHPEQTVLEEGTQTGLKHTR